MKVSDYLVSLFESLGINTIFGYQGGMITHLVDSISKSKNIKFIQTYHEQSAAIAAEGYARASGKFGVAISTSGPGATNMVTGIANAFFDSIPVVYITGQVNTYEYKYQKRIRQLGFQETDIISIVKPITKYAVMITDPNSIPEEFNKAISIATSGRKGPVLIDLPMDIQRTDINVSVVNRDIPLVSLPQINTKELTKAIKSLLSADRPLVLCGGGIASSNASGIVNQFLTKTRLPFVVSLMGKGCVDETLESFVGMIGSYGNRDANILLSRSDVVLVLGSRLDLRQTGNLKSEVLKNITFIHIDLDDNELKESSLTKKINLHCDITHFISLINDKIDNLIIHAEWSNFVVRIKNTYNQDQEIIRFVENKSPYYFIKQLNCQFDNETIFTVDIGQNQMWAAQGLLIKNGSSFYTSGGLAPMGYSLHAAIGAAFASPDKKIVCVVGDGGFHIALQALMLIHQYQLNITICVMNNASLGMITQFQELYFNSNMAGTTKEGGYVVPDIEAIAKAFSLNYIKCTESDMKSIKMDKFNIVEFQICNQSKVSPKLEYNQPLYNMIPYLTSDEIELIKKGL